MISLVGWTQGYLEFVIAAVMVTAELNFSDVCKRRNKIGSQRVHVNSNKQFGVAKVARHIFLPG